MSNIKKIMSVLMLVVVIMSAGCDVQEGKGDEQNAPKTEKSDTTLKANHDEKDPELPPAPPKHKAESANKKAETRQRQEMNIKVYYPDESGLRLVGVNREIEVGKTSDKYKAAVEAVMTPPTEKNLTSALPQTKNTSALVSVEVKNGTAVVNFDKKIKNGFSGGSTGEEFLIGSVVNTLTEFSEVKNVKFLIDGKEVETLSGHMDLSEPVERMSSLMSN